MTRNGSRDSSGAILLVVMGMVGILVMLIIAAIFAVTALAQPVYVPPGVVFDLHHYRGW